MNQKIKYSRLLFLLSCVIITVFYLMGLIFFLTDKESQDKCEMTYMFEYPQYVRVSQKIDHKYPKYGLYAYGEGRITKKARNMYFDGIPVLFIPGNAGSHQQVRSLSSVALRIALNSGSLYHFDYFTVDLNSEFSALYGPVLFDQLEYVLNSINRILELYRSNPRSPKQVILIGHSVGGIVAKKAVAELLKSKENVVSLLINLATPIKRGPIYFDQQISKFYTSSSFKDEHVTSISIGGGYSDFLVPTYLTEDKGNNTLNLVSTNIPKAWVESNHVQIVWCKQIVMAINRALFDSVDLKTQQIANNTGFVKKMFEHHLIHNSGTQLPLKPNYQKTTQISHKGEWIESLLKQYTIEHKKGLTRPHWYMTAFTKLPNHEILTILAVNLEVTDWVFVCNAAYPSGKSRVCLEAEHLTQYSEIVPSIRFKRRLISINMLELITNNSEYTHVVFRALPTSEPVTFHIDLHGSDERKAKVTLPKFSLTKQAILQQTPEKALVYDLVFPELENLLQVYQLYIEPIHCSLNQHHATASLILPWSNENIHAHFTESINKPFYLRLQTSKPQNAGDARVRLTLEPTCTYKISIRLDVFGTFGQIARYYSPFLITNLAVVFLLGFQRQLKQMGKTGTIPIYFAALLDGLKEMWVLPVVFLISKISDPFLMNFLPQPEFILFPNDTVVTIAPLVLFMVSIVLVLILVGIYCVALFALESTVHKLTLKLLAKTVTLTIRFSDYFMSFLQKVPFIVAAGLVGLCFTCGGLALCVGLIFYFLKLTQMSQEYVEQVMWFILKIIAKKFKKIFGRNKWNDKDTVNTAVKESGEVKSIKECRPGTGDSTNSDVENVEEQSKKTLNANENSDVNKSNEQLSSDSADSQENYETKEKDKVKKISQTEPQIDENLAETESESSETHDHEIDVFSKLSASNNAMFFHSSMFLIWLFVTLLNIPAVLTWAHNFRYSKSLIPDESFLPGLTLSLCALPLWQFDLPRTNRKYTLHLHILTICIIFLSLLYATVSVYRLNYMLTILFALIILQQLYAPILNDEIEESNNDTEEKMQENKYDELKMKMD